MYAPGPISKRAMGGGRETMVSFSVNGSTAAVAGFGVYFIDPDWPDWDSGRGQCSLAVYSSGNKDLASKNISGKDREQVFIGFVAIDGNGNPVPAIHSARIINGSGWPGNDNNEGVTLDDFIFGKPVVKESSSEAKTTSEEQEKQTKVVKRQTTVRRDIGTIKIANLKSREVYITQGDKWIEKLQPNNPAKEMPAGEYGLAFVDDGSFITHIDLTGGETVDVVLGGISLPNLAGKQVEIIQKDSRYLAGKISSQTRFVEMGAGTYRLTFGNYYVPVTVEAGKVTEFLLGAIRIPNLTDQAEVVTQQGDTYLGPILPNVGVMEVPPGTYKVRISGQWIEGIEVGANDEIVIE
jgi:hypothetical protein